MTTIYHNHIIQQNWISRFFTIKYIKKTSTFPLYISRQIPEFYTIVDSASGKSRAVYLPDSIAAVFSELYTRRSSEKLFSKYVGDGPSGPYRYLDPCSFLRSPTRLKKSNETLFHRKGHEKGMDSVLRNALASSYTIDYKALNIDCRSSFPAHYVEYYDMLRKTQSFAPPPNAEDFGLQRPPLHQLQEAVEVMFQKVIMDSLPDYERIIQETSRYANTTLVNYRENDAPVKLKNMYEAELAYYKANIPEYYAIKKDFIDKYKNWE